jgi:hypothetical protein
LQMRLENAYTQNEAPFSRILVSRQFHFKIFDSAELHRSDRGQKWVPIGWCVKPRVTNFGTIRG